MSYFLGCEVLGIASDLCHATYSAMKLRAKNKYGFIDHQAILEILIEFFQRNDSRIQMDYDKRISQTGQKSWIRFFFTEFLIEMFVTELVNEYEIDAYDILLKERWYDPYSRNIKSKCIKLFMEREANLAFGRYYRNEAYKSREKCELFLKFLDKLLNRDDPKSKLNAFYIIRHTVPTGIEGKGESDYIINKAFIPLLAAIAMDPIRDKIGRRYDPFFKANII